MNSDNAIKTRNEKNHDPDGLWREIERLSDQLTQAQETAQHWYFTQHTRAFLAN